MVVRIYHGFRVWMKGTVDIFQVESFKKSAGENQSSEKYHSNKSLRRLNASLASAIAFRSSSSRSLSFESSESRSAIDIGFARAVHFGRGTVGKLALLSI